MARGERGAGLGGPPDLGHPGEEDQHVAGGSLVHQPSNGRCHPILQAVVAGRVGGGEVLDRDLEEASLGTHGGRVEEAGHRPGVERGRHGHQPEVGAGGLLEAAEERQCQVALQVALVELVEHDRADAGQAGLGDQPPGEQSLGDVAQAGSRPGHLLESHLPAHGLARALPHLLGDPTRGHAGSEAPRLEDHHLAVAGQAGLEECAGNPGGLAGAGWGLDDERPAPAEGRDDVWQDGVDRERQHAATSITPPERLRRTILVAAGGWVAPLRAANPRAKGVPRADGVEVRLGLRPGASTCPAGSSSRRAPRRLATGGPEATRGVHVVGACCPFLVDEGECRRAPSTGTRDSAATISVRRPGWPRRGAPPQRPNRRPRSSRRAWRMLRSVAATPPTPPSEDQRPQRRGPPRVAGARRDVAPPRRPARPGRWVSPGA